MGSLHKAWCFRPSAWPISWTATPHSYAPSRIFSVNTKFTALNSPVQRTGDTPPTLAARVLEVEHPSYVRALSLFAAGRFRVSGEEARLADGPEVQADVEIVAPGQRHERPLVAQHAQGLGERAGLEKREA